MPVFVTLGTTIGVFLYFLVKGDISNALNKVPKSIFLLLFAISILLSSLLHFNTTGFFISLLILAVLLIVLVYYINVDKNLFYLVIKISTLMSIPCAIIGIYQLVHINIELANPLLVVHDKPDERVKSIFLNANYYATMLEYVILISIYKFILVRDKESSLAFYMFIIILNAFTLYFTGCRTAWIAILFAIPFLFLFQKKFYIGTSILLSSGLLFLFTLSTGIFPRIDTILKDFSIRIEIWETALKSFIHNPLFGQGPLAYNSIYAIFDGPRAPHAHSLYIDSLLSFGIIPLIFLLIYLVYVFSNCVYSSYTKRTALIMGILFTTLFHGILDFTIMNLQTGLLFLILIHSNGLIQKNETKTV